MLMQVSIAGSTVSTPIILLVNVNVNFDDNINVDTGEHSWLDSEHPNNSFG